MRLWSLHPKYLDTKGLVALWREALLAKAVLEGNTAGYKNHPQLDRFKVSEDPLACINQYLESVYKESLLRGYSFNREKIGPFSQQYSLTVNSKQLEYESDHLLSKLKTRDYPRFTEMKEQTNIDSHPLFRIIPGDIEEWERRG